MVVGLIGSRRSVICVVNAIGPNCALVGAGTGELFGVAEGGTEVGVAAGAEVDVGMGGVAVGGGGTGVEVAGGSKASSVDGSSVANAACVRVGTCCSPVWGTGVSVAGTRVSCSAIGDSILATDSGGTCGACMFSDGSCPLKKNAPAMIAAMTPVTLVAMRARLARTVSSSRTMGNIVDRASRAERLAIVSETTIAARLNPARMTSNQDNKDIVPLLQDLDGVGCLDDDFRRSLVNLDLPAHTYHPIPV
jgi:hypothetical protein